MKLVNIVGARPQFIKASAVSRAIRSAGSSIQEVIVHTGQHYDKNMSRVFFDELEVPRPNFDLEVGSASHGAMTGQMLERLEPVLAKEKPDWVMVYGDTNSTLAGALAAVKMNVPVAHVEAGLRSFNRRMPEEINRIVTDHVSSLLFCPSRTAVVNLEKEGIKSQVHNTGDVMYDVALFYREKALKQHSLNSWGVAEKKYALSTVHRAENTDDPERLHGILEALRTIARTMPVVLPLHPRTRKLLKERGEEKLLDGLKVVEPVSYLEMVRLEASAFAILTDSGGIQKEALFHRVPCLTLRDETEWVETVEAGWNQLCGADSERILKGWQRIQSFGDREVPRPYGDGKAAEAVVKILLESE